MTETPPGEMSRIPDDIMNAYGTRLDTTLNFINNGLRSSGFRHEINRSIETIADSVDRLIPEGKEEDWAFIVSSGKSTEAAMPLFRAAEARPQSARLRLLYQEALILTPEENQTIYREEWVKGKWDPHFIIPDRVVRAVQGKKGVVFFDDRMREGKKAANTLKSMTDAGISNSYYAVFSDLGQEMLRRFHMRLDPNEFKRRVMIGTTDSDVYNTLEALSYLTSAAVNLQINNSIRYGGKYYEADAESLDQDIVRKLNEYGEYISQLEALLGVN